MPVIVSVVRSGHESLEPAKPCPARALPCLGQGIFEAQACKFVHFVGGPQPKARAEAQAEP